MRTLERITVTGYKSIRELRDFELGDINVLIGANGAGKSNFISLFKLLEYLAAERLQLFVGKNGRADYLLHFGRKITNEIAIGLEFGGSVKDAEKGSRYDIKLVPAIDGSLIFSAEEVTYLRTNGTWFKTSSSSGGQIETGLSHGLPQPDLWPQKVLATLKDLRAYHFQDTSPEAKVKQSVSIYDNDSLQHDASNLAPFLFLLQTRYQTYYKRIVSTVRLAAPFFDDFVLRPDNLKPETIRLQWHHRESKDTFDVSQLSDGTLRFLCLTTLLLQPNPPALIIIDEPELGLHPYAMGLLVEMLRSVATKSQVIISTQSVSMVSQFFPEEVIVVERENDASVFRRLNSKELEVWLEDYSLGEIWEMNLVGGRPRR
jgi:predicted ATPase